jgi:TonB family protein
VTPAATRSRRVLVLAAAAISALPLAGPAFAQEDAGVGEGAPPEEVHPPEPIGVIEAEYPEAARRGRVEGTVVLRLVIDAEGTVTSAEVVKSVDPAVDEVARAAALRARYRPARRGATPVAARVLTRVEFRLPPAPALGDLEGRLLAPGEGSTPAVGVVVTARTAGGEAHHQLTDERGGFRFEGLPVGEVLVTAQAPGLGRVQLRTEIAVGRAAGITARLLSAPAEERIEVTVRGDPAADRRRGSAEAVTVVETARARRESADLGEVLARTQGVGARRSGGLGSTTSFSLNGLTGDQLRFFLDGIPLELGGFPFGVANVPVNLVDRLEIYGGVVPIRFGADALGGAIDLVSTQDVAGAHASGSYELGSFDTHRITLSARNLHRPSGLFARLSTFFDAARNDYPIDLEVPDERGRLARARVYRFHDGYRAFGANAELGLVDRPWARRFVARLFLTDYDKEYQHDVVATVPYGGVTYGETSLGASLRYERAWSSGLALDLIGGYVYTRGHFLDVATCVYDWFGRCVRERVRPGETDTVPHDQLFVDHAGFGRGHLEWRLDARQALRLSLAPTHVTRSGDERRQSDPQERDPLAGERRLSTVVAGLEHELDLLGDRLEIVSFVKYYAQQLASEETLGRQAPTVHRAGVGEALRLRLAGNLSVKASYEYATRLPRPDEVFGDNILVGANLELAPEASHNANLGMTLDARAARTGRLRAGLNGFLRDAHQLIILIGNERTQFHQNVFGARSLGVELAASWSSPGEHVAFEGNLTYQSFRNTSAEGPFGGFEGDRIPNRPYLFANGSARFQLRDLVVPRDEVAFTFTTRYVHDYLRGWESVGLRDQKHAVPSQLVHGCGLTFVARGQPWVWSSTLEIQNLTNEAVFDYFGVQRPGRAVYVKVTAER